MNGTESDELKRLRIENARLRALLTRHWIAADEPKTIWSGKGSQSCAIAYIFCYWEMCIFKHQKLGMGNRALRAISKRLRKVLPGLRGYGDTKLRGMRLFYKGWSFLGSNSSVTTDELQNTVSCQRWSNCLTSSWMSWHTDTSLIVVSRSLSIAALHFFSLKFSRSVFTNVS